MTSTQELDDLTNVSKKALTEYDELLSKYNTLVAEHEDTKDELNQLQEVAAPMYSEYGQMHTKYEMEKSLRSAAETFATKVLKDNKKIKRESAMLAAHMSSAKPIAIDINIDEPDSVQDERIEELGATITKLQDEVANYKVELENARDEINILTTQADSIMAEREEYKFKCLSLDKDLVSTNLAVKKHQRELKSLNRVSTLAVVDYSSLEEKYETEKALRLKAESYARELQRKRNSVLEPSQRTSGADPDSEDEVLTKLKTENDKLHSELSELEIKYKSQVEELEQQLKDSSSHKNIENLEEKLEVVKDDLERLMEELEAQKKENKDLTNQIAKTERERQALQNIPLPPPPPPPPGPAAGIGRLIITKKKKKEQKLTKIVGTAAVKDESMKSALDEMMARIKSGTTTLRRVDMNTRPEDMEPANDSEGTMTEMHKYLVNMKQKQRARSPKRSEDAPNELLLKLAARRDRSNSVDLLKEDVQDAAMKRRSNSVGQESTAKEIAKGLNKQRSMDTPPVPKPRPRISQKAPKAEGISNELASKLNAALHRIPGDDTKT